MISLILAQYDGERNKNDCAEGAIVFRVKNFSIDDTKVTKLY